jgi:hypothetical protein
MVYIPPVTFLMGSPDDEPDRQEIERPQTQDTLTQGFWMHGNVIESRRDWMGWSYLEPRNDAGLALETLRFSGGHHSPGLLWLPCSIAGVD